MFFQGAAVPKHNVYVSSENPKQGDTVLIKISGMYPSAIGFFNNKTLIFFRNGNYSDWNALLGIDANLEPGKYKISVNASEEEMAKEINVEAKNFPVIKLAPAK